MMMMMMKLSLLAVLAVGVEAFSPLLQTKMSRQSALYMNVENVNTKEMIKVGVIGMGRIGLVHLEAITKAPGVTPVIVSNPTVSKAQVSQLLSYWTSMLLHASICVGRCETIQYS